MPMRDQRPAQPSSPNHNSSMDENETSSSTQDFQKATTTMPLHSTRTRLFTEETQRVHNRSSIKNKKGEPQCFTMTQENPFQSFSEHEEEEEQSHFVRVDTRTSREPFSSPKNLKGGIEDGDEASDVSSISLDSLKRFNPNATEESTSSERRTEPPPPKEIHVPMNATAKIVPEWLLSDPTPVAPPPPEAEGSSTPRNKTLPRPSAILRGVSAPSTLSNSGSAAIFRDTSSGSPQQQQQHQHRYHSQDGLVGNRPRRCHHRGPSLSFSIGSLVGQSSYLTDPTVTSSSLSYSTESKTALSQAHSLQHQPQSHHHHHRRTQSMGLQQSPSFQSQLSTGTGTTTTATRHAHHHHNSPPLKLEPTIPETTLPRARRRNPAKQEMLYVLGKVTRPVKNLVRSNSTRNRCDLRRSSGCLT